MFEQPDQEYKNLNTLQRLCAAKVAQTKKNPLRCSPGTADNVTDLWQSGVKLKSSQGLNLTRSLQVCPGSIDAITKPPLPAQHLTNQVSFRKPWRLGEGQPALHPQAK